MADGTPSYYDTVFKESLIPIIDATKIGLWDWCIPTGKVIYSRQWERIMGYGEGEAPQTLETWQASVFTQDLVQVQRAIDDYLSGKSTSYEVEYRIICQDGGVIWAQEKGVITERGPEGTPLHLVGILQDIGRIKYAEEKLWLALSEIERYNRQLQGKVQQGAERLSRLQRSARHDLEHQDRLLKAVNAVAERLISAGIEDFDTALLGSLAILGEATGVDRVYVWRNNEIEGRLFCSQLLEWSEGAAPQQGNELTVDIPYDDVIPQWRTTLAVGKCINDVVRDMLPVERAQLEPQGILSILVAPIIVVKRFWGFIGFDDCKSERRFSEAEESILRSGGLIIGGAMLRHQINQNLIAAKEEAQASARAKTSFLANMSHEIRTPMNAIVGMTAIARSAKDPADVADALDKIEGATKHLLAIINDILDMSKIDADTFRLSEDVIDLHRMLGNIENITSLEAAKKSQAFTVDIAPDVPGAIVGDELRLSQVLMNLLSNAVKFTPEEGSILLSARRHTGGKGRAMLEFLVQDTGIGIAPDKIAVLFNAFEQLDPSISRKYGGTGLGLTIAKRIVELMGGEISVESEPGHGSIFRVRIPLTAPKATAPATDAPTAEPDRYDFSRKTLLLAEDIDINREIVITLLAGTGITIECAENGQVALEAFKSAPERYNMIFMDIHMPVMDGFAATRAIRALECNAAKTVPIIAMTANSFAEDIENCIAAGMNDHVAKPIDIDEVLEKMARYME